MTERKYDKYFVSGLAPGEEEAPFFTTIAHLEESRMKGSNYYFTHVMPTTAAGAVHGPHVHKDAELMMHFGMNPDDPFDLGAEIEFCMGPEMEKYTFTRSTVVFIPPNFIHCPWTVKKVERPFLLIQIHQGPTHTEKSFRRLLPKEQRDKMLFIDEGYGDEKVIHPPKAMREAMDKKND
jgi:hypothetical protein